ncbi:long-chain-fatty-acid--CoA ligase [Mycobacterium sp.]|uniref:long-chain-fatty-acid--CoA ligase n=1 Tax=Mycobacterium sp. TaxID=1785 RepID=UPI002CE46D94|nr:long-chain-fatty-acid--CoA ligase [Mycobacterium sp.]HKP44034.1 long-chain-fatty-acid--CoA ligase [Mycobacterium sp.]
MMDVDLTLEPYVSRAEQLFAGTEIVERTTGGDVLTCYGDVIARARRLAAALHGLGINPGDRVATLCWNTVAHLECYLGVPTGGFVLHTLNFRLPVADLRYVIGHADDQVVIVDTDQLGLLDEALEGLSGVRHVVVTGPVPVEIGANIVRREVHSYADLVAGADDDYQWPQLVEKQPAGLCYTSATTGRPKGVVYSHRSQVLHATTMCTADALAISERDVILPMTPFFHANAWGLPYAAPMTGARLVLAGAGPTPADIADLIEAHGVTVAAGVPTVWTGVLEAQRERERDFTSLNRIMSGGSAIPAALADEFETRYGTVFIQAYGMTEASPCTHICRLPAAMKDRSRDEQLAVRSTQGRVLPGLQMRLVNDAGKVVPPGAGIGEIQLRGPWIADEYYRDELNSKAFQDGWYSSGDLATVDRDGFVALVDRKKDLIKSGGEWISSVELENALMGHEAVAEAAVVAVPHERWVERPLAFVATRPGAHVTADELRDRLRERFPAFWLPDAVRFVDEIPKTGAGKFAKRVLRELLQAERADTDGDPVAAQEEQRRGSPV